MKELPPHLCPRNGRQFICGDLILMCERRLFRPGVQNTEAQLSLVFAEESITFLIKIARQLGGSALPDMYLCM